MKKASSRKNIGTAHEETPQAKRAKDYREVGKLLAGHKGRVELGFPGYVIEDDALRVTGDNAVDLIRMCAEDQGQDLVEFVKHMTAQGV